MYAKSSDNVGDTEIKADLWLFLDTSLHLFWKKEAQLSTFYHRFVCKFRFSFESTVDSRYLEFQGTVKYFEISVPRHIRFAELRKQSIDQPSLKDVYVI